MPTKTELDLTADARLFRPTPDSPLPPSAARSAPSPDPQWGTNQVRELDNVWVRQSFAASTNQPLSREFVPRPCPFVDGRSSVVVVS
jgi:hypothetical protein